MFNVKKYTNVEHIMPKIKLPTESDIKVSIKFPRVKSPKADKDKGEHGLRKTNFPIRWFIKQIKI